MFKDSSDKYHQDNEGRLQKRLAKDIKVFPQKKKKKINDKMVVNDIKISLKIKNKGWFRT